MAKATSRKQTGRGAKASRSAFRAKSKPKPKPKAKPKPTPRPRRRSKAPSLSPLGDLALGEITVPSGRLGILDIGLVAYLPRPALEPAIVKVDVPRDRALPVIGRKLGGGPRWEQFAVVLADGEVATSKKLGEAGVDFAQLALVDLAALDHWQHEDSLDGRADVIFWGRDERLLAAAMVAPRVADGYGWVDLPLAQAEAKADIAARKKAENRWLLQTELRPHSHHFRALAAARADRHGAGAIELAGARAMLLLTGWGESVVPIFLELDAADRPVRIRMQLAV